MLSLSPVVPPLLTTTQRDAQTIAGKLPNGSIIRNGTTLTLQRRKEDGSWQDVINTGATLLQQPFQTFATLADVQTVLVAAGVMSPQPTFSVSGAVSGAVLANVAIALSGTTTYNTVTDAGGNFTLSGVIAGSYTLTATLIGYTFAPVSIPETVVSSSITAQNFVATAAVGGTQFGGGKIFVPTNGSTPKFFDIAALTFPNSGTTGARSGVFFNNRWFVPNATANSVQVYNAAGTSLLTTITGFSTPLAVLIESNSIAVVNNGNSTVRFINYNFGTDVGILGTSLAITHTAAAGTTGNGNGKMYVGGGSGSITEINAIPQTLGTVHSLGTAITQMCFGNNRILTDVQMHDTTTWINPVVGYASNGRACFAQNKFFIPNSTGLVVANNVGPILATITTGLNGNFPTGCATDGTTVYVALQAANGLQRIDATTNALVGGIITGITSPWFNP